MDVPRRIMVLYFIQLLKCMITYFSFGSQTHSEEITPVRELGKKENLSIIFWIYSFTESSFDKNDVSDDVSSQDKMLSSCSNACPAIGNKQFFAGLLSASLVSSADDSDSAFGVDSYDTTGSIRSRHCQSSGKMISYQRMFELLDEWHSSA